MLALTRKVGELIRLGGGISVRVLRIEAGQVRLGINAPDDIPICRSPSVSEKPGTFCETPPTVESRMTS